MLNTCKGVDRFKKIYSILNLLDLRKIPAPLTRQKHPEDFSLLSKYLQVLLRQIKILLNHFWTTQMNARFCVSPVCLYCKTSFCVAGVIAQPLYYKDAMDNFKKNIPNTNRRAQGIDGFTRSPRPISRDSIEGIRPTRQPSNFSDRPRTIRRGVGSVDGIGIHRRPASRIQVQPPVTKSHPESSGVKSFEPYKPEQPKHVNPDKPATYSPTNQIQKLNFEAPKSPRSYNPLNWFESWGKKQTIGATLLALVVVGGIFGGRAWYLLQGVFEGGGESIVLQEDVDPTSLRGEGDGRVNILLIGRDAEGTGLTDTILLASINPIQKEAALLSIPRDLYVQNSDGYYSKINAIFPNTVRQFVDTSGSNGPGVQKKAENAGIKALSDVVSSKIGLPVHYHTMIDLKGFQKAINTVGGVDAKVPEQLAVYDQMRFNGQDYTLNVKAGNQHFGGLKAMAFARTRYTSQRGDFDRSERQRLIISALKSKIMDIGTFGDPRKVNGLMSDFEGHIRTNLGIEEAVRLYEIAQEIDNSKIRSIGLADEPHQVVTTSMVDGQSVVIPTAGLEDYRDLQHFVRNRLRDGFLAQEDAKIKILNGTTIPGLASRTAENLKSFGYNVTGIGDAPTRGYHTTMLIDMSTDGKKYTKRYLENRFYIGARNILPDPQIEPKEADFVIILGQNEQVRLTTSASE